MSIAGVILIAAAIAAAVVLSLDALPVGVSAAMLVAAAAAAVCGPLLLGKRVAERLVLLYIFLTPFQFAVLGGSLFPQRAGDFGLRLSLSDLVFPVLLLVLLQKRVDDRSAVRSKTGLLLIALILALSVSLAQSVSHLGALTAFSTGKFLGLASMIVLTAALIEVIRERSLWMRALNALTLSGVAAGVIGLVGWLLWRLGGVSTYLINIDRLNSTMFGDPNIFASLMAVTLILAIVRIRFSSPTSRWFWAGCALIALVALILSQSRSGYIAAAAGLTVLALWYKPSLGVAAVTSLILLAAIVWAGYAWVGSGETDISNNPRFTRETLDSRLELWARGATLLPKESLSGIGVGTFEQITFVEGSERLRTGFARAHNTYLTILLELGLAGSAAFVLLAVGIARAIRQGRGYLEGASLWGLAGVVSCLGAMLVFAISVDALYQRHIWILIALVLATPNIVETARRHAAITLNSGPLSKSQP